MVTPPRPATTHPRTGGLLAESLITLASTPDDDSEIQHRLVMIAQLVAAMVSPVSYASVTAIRDGTHTTVATSSELALAVDSAQYAEHAGPCLDAVDTGTPVAVPDIATTVSWPRFREQAFQLGLRASLSIPLFAGSGEPIAALNLYGHDPDALAPLIEQVWAVYDPGRTPTGREIKDAAALDAGSEELLAGLTEAFLIRALIHQAIGVIMAHEHQSADEAYLVLRLRAAEAGTSLTDAATTVIGSRPNP